MGNVHARQYRKRSDVELFFYDHNPERSRRFTEAWDVERKESLDELLSAVDIVDICLPTPGHADAGHQSIAAGRATLIEKPLARTVADAVSLANAAEKTGVPLMPAHVLRFFPEYAAATQVVKSGELGTPAAARARRGAGAPSGTDGWFLDHSKSGGVLLDLSIHDFDWLRWTVGEVKLIYSRTVGAKVGRGVDYGLTTMTFDNGCIAHVEGTWMDPGGFRMAFEIAGSKGLIQHDSRENAALRTTVFAQPGEGAPLPNLEGSGLPTEDPYYLEIDGFLSSLRDKVAPPVSALDGIMAISIAEAATESAKTDRTVVPARSF